MNKRTATGGASASPPTAKVVPIRPKLKVRKRNREEDELTVSFARLAAKSKERAHELAQTEPGSEAHRTALALSGVDRRLPRNNLRLIASTLDERRDFLLRCAEVELLKAEHALECRRIDRLSILEGDAAWRDSPILRPLVDENNARWDKYRARLLELAQTPARTHLHLDRKKSIIGRMWLTDEGEWSDKLRAGVAADEAWLAANVPSRQRRRA